MIFKKKFNQQKFNKLISKAFNYLQDNIESDIERIKIIEENQLLKLAIIESNKMKAKDNVCCAVNPLIEHLEYKVDKLPDGRNNWTTENVYHLISLWMMARNPKTGRYDDSIKRKVSSKYGFSEDNITNNVNRLINETLRCDKYGILKNNLLTREQLIIFKFRDNKVRNNCIKYNKLSKEELDIINKVYNTTNIIK